MLDLFGKVLKVPLDDPNAKEKVSPLDVWGFESRLNGPTSLKTAMRAYIEDPQYGNLPPIEAGLEDEIKRIQTNLIASLGHPNNKGAASYANNAIRRLGEYRAVLQQVNQEQPLGQPSAIPGQTETLDAKLRRYRLRGTGSLYADLTHLDVDSLTVRTVTAENSDKNFVTNILLVVTTQEANGDTGRRRYQLNLDYRLRSAPTGNSSVPFVYLEKLYPQFEPSVVERFAVDTRGTLRLDEIIGCAIVVGSDPNPQGSQLSRTGGSGAQKP